MANVTATIGADNFDGIAGTTAGNDVITAANGTANTGDVWNGGTGTDTLRLVSKFVNIDISQVDAVGIESIVANKRGDRVTVSFEQFGSFSKIDLGKGGDTLTVSASGVVDVGSAIFANLINVENLRLAGSLGDDSLTISGSQLSGFASIAMQQGADVLNLTSTSANFNALGASDAAITGLEAVSAAAAGASVTVSLSGQGEGFSLTGSTFADTITGGNGDDAVSGGKGGDALNGGAGLDTLDYSQSAAKVVVNLGTGVAANGDAAGDTFTGFENVTGTAFADTLTGDAGSNRLSGGGSKDLLQGGAGADHLDGGTANDMASYAASAAAVTVNLDAGTGSGGDAEGDTFHLIEFLKGSAHDDNLTGSNGVNILLSGNGNDVVSALGGNDKVATGKGNDQADGGGGNDRLIGNGGGDTLAGGDGNDQLYGNSGADTLTGGADADTFYFASIAHAGKGKSSDVITDFQSGADKIGLAQIDADKTASSNQAFSFIGSGDFSGTGGELRYNASTGIIEGDVTGDGQADFMIKVGAGTIILESDFLL